MCKVGFVEVLWGALAGLRHEKYKLDTEQWCRAVSAMKDARPDLLPRVFFVERPPLAPHSKEVMYFLDILQDELAITKADAPMETVDLSTERKAALLKGFEPFAAEITKQDLRTLTALLEGHIEAVPS